MEQAERSFCSLMKTVTAAEDQLERLRQGLNEEPLFNVADIFSHLSSATAVNAFDLQTFAGCDQKVLTAVESVIKMYTHNQALSLSKQQLSQLFMARRNPVIAKLALERPNYGLVEPETKDLCVKILLLEVQLHQRLIKYRAGNDVSFILPRISEEIYVDMDKLKSLAEGKGIDIDVDLLMEYVNRGSKARNVLVKSFQELLSPTNSKVVKEFLTRPNVHPKNLNPLIDARFQSLLSSPKTVNCFNHREKRSIESHLNRMKCKRRFEVYTKLDLYRKLVEEEALALVKAIKDIIYLEKEIEYSKMELNLCSDFYARYFFEAYELDRQWRIIPSTMKYHLDLFGLDCELSDIYYLFKRYAGEDGKLNCLQFQSMFLPAQKEYSLIPRNPKVSLLSQISPQTKKLYLCVLENIITNQKAIQRIKTQLYEREFFDMRNIFSCIDNDEDGCVSVLDFQVLVKRYTGLEMGRLDLELLSRRFRKSSGEEMICYAEFVLEMAPRSPTLNKCRSCLSPKIKHSC